MPITGSGGNATQTNPYSALAAQMGGQATPGVTLPAAPTVNTTPVSPNTPMTSQNAIALLANNAPTSLTSTIMPLLQSVFGGEQNLMKPIFEQQGEQGAASAQTDAMKRGMTGSSIEAANMTGARAAANQGYNQYLAQMISQLVPQYTQAAQFDIGQQSNYYSNLAQAVGQGAAANTEMEQFKIAQANAARAAADQSNATMQAGIFGGLGSAFSAFCDIRLKDKVTKIGEYRGVGMYAYVYKHDKGIDLPHGVQIGVLAHEVAAKWPHTLSVEKGYLKVDYKKLVEAA